MIKDNHRCSDFSRSGSQYKPVYTPHITDSGIVELEQTGFEDTVEYMNSFKDQLDPNSIVKRMTLGEYIPPVGPGVFMDVVGAPSSLAEAMQVLARTEAQFNALPVEIKQKFDNSFYKFISEAGSESWLKAFGDSVSDPVSADPKPIEPVKEVPADA